MKIVNKAKAKSLILCILFIKTGFLGAMEDFNHPIKPKPVIPITLKNPEIKGLIEAPKTWSSVPEFRIFYEGKQTVNDSNGIYTFPTEDRNIKKLYLLICKELNQNFSSINTIQNIDISPKRPYKFYSLKKNDLTGDWKITEKPMTKKKFIVPQNCFIILINSKYIAEIKNWDFKAPENMVKLPQIVLKKEFDEKQARREADKSVLRSLDLNPFHENIGKKLKKDAKPNVDLTLSQAS